MPSPISPHQRRQSDRQFPPFVQHAARRRPATRSPHLASSSNTKAHVKFGPLLVKENKIFVKLKNAYVLEVEKCENLTRELSMCNDSISTLRMENDNLNAKIEELSICKASTSTVENVTICTRCKDINVEAIDDHLAMIKQQNDHMPKLPSMNLKMKSLNLLEACSITGDALALRMALVSNKGAKAMSS
jgi:hypothetical protein